MTKTQLQKLPREAILAMVQNSPKILQILNDIQNWDLVWFNPVNREIHVEMATNIGIKTLSFVIPIPETVVRYRS